MKPSPTMQRIIQALAQSHNVNLLAENAHLLLTMAGYEPLFIQSIGLARVTVAHYFTQNGDLVPDPSVTFFTGDPSGWIPIGITHSFGGSHTYAMVTEDGTQAVCLAHPKQAELAEFTEVWAQNIIDQQWLESGQQKQAPLFPLGRVVATPGALAALQAVGKHPEEFLERHVHGDWGDLPVEDVQANQQALQDGSRLFSAYQVTTTLKIWVITEHDRSATTILLPSEY